jgi:hypothetical protein
MIKMDRGIRTFGGSSSGGTSPEESNSPWAGQKWEYKTILRIRNAKKDGSPRYADKWDVKIEEQLPGLGEEGWELIAVSPRSGVLGGVMFPDASYTRDALISAIASHPYSGDYAGFTDEELWVFKRPKP